MISGKSNPRSIVVACVCAAAAMISAAANPQPPGSSAQNETVVQNGSARITSLPQATSIAPRQLPLASSTRPALAADGLTAATGPDTTVYSNEIAPPPGVNLQVWEPGVAQFMADDLELASGACDVTYYNLVVFGWGESGPTFNVHVALWDGDPCDTGSSMFPGSEDLFTVPNDGEVHLVELTPAAPVSVTTDVVWLEATFSTSDSGWIVAEEAEIGYSRDLFVENDLPPPDGYGCSELFFDGSPYASFWANVRCELPFDPPGACCEGATCSEITEAGCTDAGGAWLGAYTTCNPSPCATGACCTEDDFTTCTDTTEAECVASDGLFHAATTCAAEPCEAQFYLYRNDHPPVGVYLNTDWTILADDQVMAAGAPCELASFDLNVYGAGFTGSYDVTVDLWEADGTTGLPLRSIDPGIRTVFHDVGDGGYRTLLAGPFSGVTLPKNVWMTVWTTTNDSGWLIGQQATLGYTEDSYAIYDGMSWVLYDFPELWSGFGANVRCYGVAPKGACCNNAAGTCIDDVHEWRCDGRWTAGATCAPDPFDPPCGASACCTVMGGCQDKTPEQCTAIDGDLARGALCADINGECPRVTCLEGAGDCFTEQPTPGCEDAFCCETVCEIDVNCCNNAWDDNCTEMAKSYCLIPPPNDHCTDAEVIMVEGTFAFDNTQATTDGPPHIACTSVDGDDQTVHDVWYCWTSPCTSTVYLQTCGLTDVDTKVNMYEGCETCPPTDSDLIECNDDFCGYDPNDPEAPPLQSQASFHATEGQSYLIRLGTFPGGGGLGPAEGGPGELRITCGIPDNPECPGSGHCCLGTASRACLDKTCCDTVCTCDAYCCDVLWDEACATTGFEDSGCGAEVLCTVLCENLVCPPGIVQFVRPPGGLVDARQPHPPSDATDRQGEDMFLVEAPSGADVLSCWTLCETAVDELANAVGHVEDNLNGTMTIGLLRPITPGAVTTITYTDDYFEHSTTGTFTSHPANVDADSMSSPVDILRVIDYLNGAATSPWGIYSEDVDHSGLLGPPDILRVIDLLNGAGEYDPWLNEPLPDCGICCP